MASPRSFSALSLSDILLLILWTIPALIAAFLALMLISPAFSIAASRQTRTLALLASQGATPRHISWAVLIYGFVAGLVGATVGMVLGG